MPQAKNANSTEIYQNADKSVQFYISHSTKEFSTGVLILKSKASLPKHNRPHAIENLTQISGKCLMKLFYKDNIIRKFQLKPGEGLRMPKGQFHIHTNPYQEPSVTLWKAEGNIVDIISQIKKSFRKVSSNIPKNLI